MSPKKLSKTEKAKRKIKKVRVAPKKSVRKVKRTKKKIKSVAVKTKKARVFIQKFGKKYKKTRYQKTIERYRTQKTKGKGDGLSPNQKEKIYFDAIAKRKTEIKKTSFSKSMIQNHIKNAKTKFTPKSLINLHRTAREKLTHAVMHFEFDIDIHRQDDEVIKDYNKKTIVTDKIYDAVQNMSNIIKNIEDSPRVKKVELINIRPIFHQRLDFLKR